METYEAQSYDLAVIGAGHAGVEAALAAARLGVSTVLFTISLDGLANMPCNPSIGGTAKAIWYGKSTRWAARWARRRTLPLFRAACSTAARDRQSTPLRVQADRQRYHIYMKQVIERQENLDLKQAEIVEIRAKDGRVESVVTHLGAVHRIKTAILCTGTFLRGRIFCRRCFLRKRFGRTACGDPLERIIAGAGYSAAAL